MKRLALILIPIAAIYVNGVTVKSSIILFIAAYILGVLAYWISTDRKTQENDGETPLIPKREPGTGLKAGTWYKYTVTHSEWARDYFLIKFSGKLGESTHFGFDLKGVWNIITLIDYEAERMVEVPRPVIRNKMQEYGKSQNWSISKTRKFIDENL